MTTIPETAGQRHCWFVGAVWTYENGASEDQTARFLQDGTWENGWDDDRFHDKVKAIRPGDRIAIKARSFSPNRKLPFPNPGQHTVAGMQIKAIGTVTANPGNGLYVEVDWTPFDPPREWYFNMVGQTIHRVLPGQRWDYDELIDFAFENKPQDIGRFRNAPKWREKFGDPQPPSESAPDSTDDPDMDDMEEDDGAVDAAYSIDNIIAEGCFLERARLEEILDHWQSKMNLILQGPPGTGKTWLARKLAYALIGQKNQSLVQAVQFHSNLSYEDFVRGWRPAGSGKLELVDGPFLNVVDAARHDPGSDYVMVIEEINRGNPAQVFGEMLTLLEADKRNEGEALALSYRKSEDERVHIPDNLYVIGTMNIADRSLALVDLAFRRRFAFEELEPTFGQPWRDWVSEQCGIDAQFLAGVEQRLANLNQQIADDRSLGRQFRVGHSYVTPPAGNQIRDARLWFRQVVEKEIGPLLDEYWFDSLETAQQAKSALLQGL